MKPSDGNPAAFKLRYKVSIPHIELSVKYAIRFLSKQAEKRDWKGIFPAGLKQVS